YHEWRVNQTTINDKIGIDLSLKKLRSENSLVVAKRYYQLRKQKSIDERTPEENELLNLLENQRFLGRYILALADTFLKTEETYMNQQGICEMCNVMIQTAPMDAINGLQNLPPSEEENAEDLEKAFASGDFDFGTVLTALSFLKDVLSLRMVRNYLQATDKEPYPTKEMEAIRAQIPSNLIV